MAALPGHARLASIRLFVHDVATTAATVIRFVATTIATFAISFLDVALSLRWERAREVIPPATRIVTAPRAPVTHLEPSFVGAGLAFRRWR